MADSVGGTPLEAAALALFHWEKDEIWGGKVHVIHPDSDEALIKFRLAARAALTAAIDALPASGYPLGVGRFLHGHYIQTVALRRALGLEGDQG